MKNLRFDPPNENDFSIHSKHPNFRHTIGLLYSQFCYLSRDISSSSPKHTYIDGNNSHNLHYQTSSPTNDYFASRKPIKNATSQRKLRRSRHANSKDDFGATSLSPKAARLFVGMAAHVNEGKKSQFAAYQREPSAFLGGSYHSVHAFRHGHAPSNFVSEYRPVGIHDLNSSDVRAPNQEASLPLVWAEEPQAQLLFSNDTGAVLNCAARAPGGYPPTVAWSTQDGRPFLPVPGLVEQLSNGSLWFLPFPGHRFDASLHRVIISCTVACDRGALISRPSAVTAVVMGDYEVQAYDQVVVAGNIAVFTCHVPPELHDILVVTSWLVDGSVEIFPSLYGGEVLSVFNSFSLPFTIS
ncbi:Down syndrome cell adhesion molecule homolog [Hyalella azteca]|uniref:Down syndrome cell adhesion molecule homolog n=1 Tax=Hyalella azteca TaxID=294128 RepID=A0A979FY92_HYAAZ|nr:Down syndrome cell adhesion molecule homolog [Hyalella azteca]